MNKIAKLANYFAIKYDPSFYRYAASKPKLYFLIGPPAVGKSTWINENASNATVCNRDDEVISAAQETGVGTYDDMFQRPSTDIMAGLSTPDKDTFLAAESGDEQAKAKIDQFMSELPKRAKQYKKTADPKQLQQFGDVIPYSYDDLKTVIVNYGVPAQYVTPFEFSNVQTANNLVTEKFNTSRGRAVESGNDIIIDMTNLNKSSRDDHRKFIVATKEGINYKEADPNNINNYYEQIAIVFASPEGYSPEEQSKLKQVAKMRAEEIRAAGGSKTIPDSAYDRMFGSFEAPGKNEGFSDIQYVGIPSLKKLAKIINRLLKNMNKIAKLANYFEVKYSYWTDKKGPKSDRTFDFSNKSTDNENEPIELSDMSKSDETVDFAKGPKVIKTNRSLQTGLGAILDFPEGRYGKMTSDGFIAQARLNKENFDELLITVRFDTYHSVYMLYVNDDYLKIEAPEFFKKDRPVKFFPEEYNDIAKWIFYDAVNIAEHLYGYKPNQYVINRIMEKARQLQITLSENQEAVLKTVRRQNEIRKKEKSKDK